MIEYVGDREQIIELLRHFHYESANVPQTVIKTSGRELNNSYQEKLKSELEGKAEHYADKLVPWTLGATGLTYLLTRPVHSQRHIRLWLMW